jgi:serine/threonine-protein kinase ATR
MLQQIYAGIDEPDAMIGLSSLKTQTSLEDAIIESESEGNWSDGTSAVRPPLGRLIALTNRLIIALMAIDQAMQQQSNSADQLRHLQVSRLRCLLQMGLFEQAMTTVRSALIDPIHNSGQNANLLRSFGVQAAWRLNNWRIAEEFIEQGCVPDFDLHVAKIMIAIRKRNEEAYLVAIQEARNVMTTPLAAARFVWFA